MKGYLIRIHRLSNLFTILILLMSQYELSLMSPVRSGLSIFKYTWCIPWRLCLCISSSPLSTTSCSHISFVIFHPCSCIMVCILPNSVTISCVKYSLTMIFCFCTTFTIMFIGTITCENTYAS